MRALAVLIAVLYGCSPPPPYDKADCPLYSELGPVRANPAGALGRSFEVQLAFKVCPPEAGLAEIRRKRIELKQALLKHMSAMTTAQLDDPLRIETLQKDVHLLVNKQVLKKARVIETFVTGFEVK